MSREDTIFYAKLAEQAERYEDMVKHMKEIANVQDTPRLLVGHSGTNKRGAQPPQRGLQELGGNSQNGLEGSDCH